MSEIKTHESIHRINETQSWLFEKITKGNNNNKGLLARSIKKKEIIQIITTGNDEDFLFNAMEIQNIVRH